MCRRRFNFVHHKAYVVNLHDAHLTKLWNSHSLNSNVHDYDSTLIIQQWKLSASADPFNWIRSTFCGCFRTNCFSLKQEWRANNKRNGIEIRYGRIMFNYCELYGVIKESFCGIIWSFPSKGERFGLKSLNFILPIVLCNERQGSCLHKTHIPKGFFTGTFFARM